jgi:peptidoglycan hydrolase-like protein with peptidoglycan-binding domain
MTGKHTASTARRSGPTRRLADWLRSRPLVLAIFVIAALTMAASAYQNAQGRADSTPPPAAAPPADECPTADACEQESVDGLGDPEPTEDAPAHTPPAPSPDVPQAPGTPGATPPPGTGNAQTPAPGPRTWPLVKSGDRGETVAAIQLLLTAHGYRTAPDAVYGPATTSQVTVYQRDRSLADDGITGPDTWHALIVTVRAGDRGPAVTAAQRLLTAHGHPVPANGAFDEATAQAVTAFQTARALAPDGVVGPDTWSALVTLEQP